MMTERTINLLRTAIIRITDCIKRNRFAFTLSLGLFCGLLLRLAYAAHLPLSNDEGSYLYDGLLLSQGKWPFLTSFSRAPALMFLTSVVVKVFGRSFLAGRMISILAGLGSAYLLYLIGRRLFSPRVGVFAFLFYALLAPCVAHTIYLHTQPLELFFVLVGIWFVAQILFDQPVLPRQFTNPSVLGFSTRRVFLGGAFFGLAVLVRETAALYPAVAVLAILLLSREDFWRRVWAALALGVFSLAVWGSVWGFIISQVGFARVKAVFLAIMTMHDTGEYMSFGFTLRRKFEVFYGALGENFLLYFLVAVFAAILATRVIRAIGGMRRVGVQELGRNWVFLLFFVSVPFLFYGLYYRRLQAEYLAEFMPAMVLMSAVALDQMVESVKCKSKSAKFFIVPIVIVFGLSLLAVNYRYQWEHQHGGSFSQEALESSVRFIKSEAGPGEEIFTAAVAIPFLSGNPLALNISRPVIFSYPHLSPEIKYILYPREEEIISYLRGAPVEWVVMEHEARDIFLRSGEALKDYLKHNYDIIRVIVDEDTGTEIWIACRRTS